MRAQLLGVPTALGMPRVVSEDGPTALRRIGLVQALEQFVEVTDFGDMPVEKPGTGDGQGQLLEKVIDTAYLQANAFTDIYAADCLPITLGGDHTTSLGTALALAQLGVPFDVVWMDAHADFNTPITSPLGHAHGMVLAILAGFTPYLPQIVAPGRLHLWGARDLDVGERQFLEAMGVDVRDPVAMRTEWPDLVRDLSQNVLLSFDCDCCQPDVAPGTLTPVAGGFERPEALGMVREVSSRRRVLALDVVELHPDLDFKNRTARLARDVILTVAAAQSRHQAAAPALHSYSWAQATRRCG
jgi:arginase